MKRASLAAVPVTNKAEASDLTDRILARTSGSPQTAPSAREEQPAPASGPGPAPAAAEPTSTSAAASRSAALREALDQSQAAVESLTAAARSAPARYDLALRYRLDALAHHLRQVAEFLAAAGGK